MTSLRIAFQIDPLASLNAASDSGLALAEAALTRGYECDFYAPDSLVFKNGALTASLSSVTFDKSRAEWRESPQRRADLTDYDVILVRQNPPYDMQYLTYAHMLRRIDDKVTILNSPRALCDFPEKISPLLFPEFMPPTLVTKNAEAIAEFMNKEGDIVLKPLYEFGGGGVKKIAKGDDNAVRSFIAAQGCPVMAQRFLPQVTKKGDRRIILIDGDVGGSVLRMPEEGSFIANMVAGGKAAAAPLSQREKDVCAALRPFLKDSGIFLAGIDVIDGYLTEINITSPTGFRPIAALDNPGIADMFWDRAVSLCRQSLS